jgi:peptidoglycan/xylan/chitin deacetylase (PgdA/CDA1 family)
MAASRATRQNPAATLRDTARDAPRLFIILDDSFKGNNAAIVEAEKRGMRVSLAVCVRLVFTDSSTADNMTWTQLQQAALRGHGIMAHSMTHANMTTLTPAERAVEFDDCKSTLEAILGVPVENWVYPVSAHNITTDSEGYLRFKRLFAREAGGDQWRHKFWKPHPVLHGRYGWDSARHYTVMNQVIDAAAAAEDIVIYTHTTDGSTSANGSPQTGVTLAEFCEMLDLAMALRMPVVSIDEMGDLPPGPVDPGFEDAANFATNFEVINTVPGAGSAAIVAEPTATGLPGSSVLKITNTDASNKVTVRQRIRLPYTPYPATATNMVFGARIKCDRTSGTGGASLRIILADKDGVLNSSGGRAQVSPTYSTNAWSAAGEVLTAEIAFNVGQASYPRVTYEYRLWDCVGEAWFDNAQMSAPGHDFIA